MLTYYYSRSCGRSKSQNIPRNFSKPPCYLECFHCQATRNGKLFCDLHMMQKVN